MKNIIYGFLGCAALVMIIYVSVNSMRVIYAGKLLEQTKDVSVILQIHKEDHAAYPLTKLEALEYIKSKNEIVGSIINPERFTYYGNSPVKDPKSGLPILAELETQYGAIQFYEDCHRAYKKE